MTVLFAFLDPIALLRGALGIAVLILIAWLCGKHRSKVNWRLIGSLLLLQMVLAIVLLKVSFVRKIFEWTATLYVKIIDFTEAGTVLILGEFLGKRPPDGGIGFSFAFHALPTIVVISAITSLLYYLNVLQYIIYGFAWIMHRIAGISGAESLAAAANVFVGQTEAPLVVKPYIGRMTRSELLCMMSGGMATIAGSVFALYMQVLGGDDPAAQTEIGVHLLVASIISAPAAIIAAKLLMPETEDFDKELKFPRDKAGANALDALCTGTGEGVRLCVNVAAMLLVFTALVYGVNWFLAAGIGSWTGLNDMVATWSNGTHDSLSLQFILGRLLAPVAWLIGVAPGDLTTVGQLLGEKTILNEFYAYFTMGNMGPDAFVDERSRIITIYALCGFANIASVGIQIGGIGVLAPERRVALSELGIRSLIGGTIACLMTACIAGMLY